MKLEENIMQDLALFVDQNHFRVETSLWKLLRFSKNRYNKQISVDA